VVFALGGTAQSLRLPTSAASIRRRGAQCVSIQRRLTAPVRSDGSLSRAHHRLARRGGLCESYGVVGAFFPHLASSSRKPQRSSPYELSFIAPIAGLSGLCQSRVSLNCLCSGALGEAWRCSASLSTHEPALQADDCSERVSLRELSSACSKSSPSSTARPCSLLVSVVAIDDLVMCVTGLGVRESRPRPRRASFFSPLG